MLIEFNFQILLRMFGPIPLWGCVCSKWILGSIVLAWWPWHRQPHWSHWKQHWSWADLAVGWLEGQEKTQGTGAIQQQLQLCVLGTLPSILALCNHEAISYSNTPLSIRMGHLENCLRRRKPCFVGNVGTSDLVIRISVPGPDFAKKAPDRGNKSRFLGTWIATVGNSHLLIMRSKSLTHLLLLGLAQLRSAIISQWAGLWALPVYLFYQKGSNRSLYCFGLCCEQPYGVFFLLDSAPASASLVSSSYLTPCPKGFGSAMYAGLARQLSR